MTRGQSSARRLFGAVVALMVAASCVARRVADVSDGILVVRPHRDEVVVELWNCATLGDAVLRVDEEDGGVLGVSDRRMVDGAGWYSCAGTRWRRPWAREASTVRRLSISDDSGELLFAGEGILAPRAIALTRSDGGQIKSSWELVPVSVGETLTVEFTPRSDTITAAHASAVTKEGQWRQELAFDGGAASFAVPAFVRGGATLSIRTTFARRGVCRGPAGLTCSADTQPCVDCPLEEASLTTRLLVSPTNPAR